MDLALIFSALLMGLAGTPHCVAMCGAGCAAVTRGGRSGDTWSFHLGRLAGYSAAGAVTASSVGALALLGQSAGVLRPLWTLVHMAALGLGLWLMWQGRQPTWLERIGRTRVQSLAHRDRGGWHVVAPPLRSGAAGLSWVAWPCGLLQSALLVAALANSAWSGALIMAAFAAASSVGLLVGPMLWRRGSHRAGANRLSTTTVVRLAGAALASASAWALGHGLWSRVAAWCGL